MPSRTDDVWAVGQWRSFSGTDYDHPLIEHWDGSNWTALRSPHPSKPISILSGVGAYAADDVWALGYEEDVGSSYRTLIEHWDGTAWAIAQDATLRRLAHECVPRSPPMTSGR